jgi:hypothetical protein
MAKRNSYAPPHEYTSVFADQTEVGPASVEWYERERWHLTSAATPLNARGLLVPGSNDRLYVHEALDHVNDVLHGAIQRSAGDRISSRVFGHLEIAVQSALFTRIEENEQKSIPADCDEWSVELFQRACLGVATPWELLALLATFPDHLQSLELAKQTHPTDWLAADDMDVEVDALLHDTEAIIRETERTQNVRYGLARVDDTMNPEVATFVRKAEKGLVPLDDGGHLTIMQRDCLVVDMTHDDAMNIGKHMRGWLAIPETKEQLRGSRKVPYRGDALREFVSEQLATQETLRSPALVPAVRSYYAFYTPPIDNNYFG